MKTLLLWMSFFISITMVSAQGWDRTYNIPNSFGVSTVISVDDGGFIVMGNNYYMKVDSVGNQLWLKTNTANYFSIMQTSDQNFLIAGEKDSTVFLEKIDTEGAILYSTKYETGDHMRPTKVVEYNGNYLVTGFTYNLFNTTPLQYTQTFLLKTDLSGNLIWSKTYNEKTATRTSSGYHVQLDTDDNYTIWGTKRIDDNYGAQVIKVDASTGDTLWTKQINMGLNYGFIPTPILLQGVPTSDGGYISSGEGIGYYFQYLFNKYNASHQLEWSKTITIADTAHFYNVKCVAQISNGSYITGGIGFAPPPLLSSMYIANISATGDTIWTSKIDSSPGTTFELISAVAVCQDGYVFGTSMGITGVVRVIKTNKSGNRLPNKISGTFYVDANNNCVKDPEEKGAPFGKVIIQPGNIIASADTAGKYVFSATEGTYTISSIPSDLWEVVCPDNTYSVAFGEFPTEYNNADIALKPKKICSRMVVDVSTPLQRRCFRNTYTVRYANEGTKISLDTELELELNASIVPLSISKSYTKVGNKYTFPIGVLSPGEGGTIKIIDSISCEAPNGATVCVVAKITPGNDCDLVSPSWDSSRVFVDGQCLHDTTIQFVIKNRGEKGKGDMDEPGHYRIYKNDEFTELNLFQLMGQDSLVIERPADGSTIRIEAEQSPNHPGHSMPRISIEGCSLLPIDIADMGHIISVPEDDQDDTIEIDCQEIIGSYDPNDKSVKPAGATSEHFIRSTDELEYLIRFQNTGTDTAFTVKIKDTISTNLDLTTFKTVGASHNYNYTIRGNVITWVFDNILLPDSNIDLLGSNGFVKYKISPQTNIPQMSSIQNSADIYFDFNPPVKTNTTQNVINNAYSLVMVTSTEKANTREALKLLVYPNPSFDYSTISAANEINGKVIIYDITGTEILQIRMLKGMATIEKGMLDKGVYMVKVYDEKGLSGSSKIVIE